MCIKEKKTKLRTVLDFTSMCVAALIVVLFINFTIVSPVMAQEKMSVFEVMRLSMSDNPASTAAEYLGQSAKKKWKDKVATVLSTADIKYFFAFSVIEFVAYSNDSAEIIYFNPWIDGILLTVWHQHNEKWFINDFAFIRGEALRGETVSEKNAAPPWLRIRGTLIGNMADYFHSTNNLLHRESGNLTKFMDKQHADGRALSLISIAARMYTRTTYARKLLQDGVLRKKIVAKLNDIKSALASKKKGAISSILPSASQSEIGTLALLPKEVSRTLVGNWFIEKDGHIVILISSYIAPRLFLYIDLIKKDTKVDGVLLVDWVTISKLSLEKNTKGQSG